MRDIEEMEDDDPMGHDPTELYMYGMNPKSDKGRHFRNNILWWRPLWNYLIHNCSDLLTENQLNSSHDWDFKDISEKQALLIAQRLNEHIASGKVETYSNIFEYIKGTSGPVPCTYCNGEGVITKDYTNYKESDCDVCHGDRVISIISVFYYFSENNVKRFADFAQNSGGINIYNELQPMYR